jgi:hypothetical protein
MKLTFDFPDELVLQARDVAAQRGITFDALVEKGLCALLAEDERDEPIGDSSAGRD